MFEAPHAAAILTLREGKANGWHVCHEESEPQLEQTGTKPWAVALFHNGVLKREAQRFSFEDEAEQAEAKWAYEDDLARDEIPDARDTALDPHGPWGAP